MNHHLATGALLVGLAAAWYAGFGHRRFAAIAAHQAAIATAYQRAERVAAEAAVASDLEHTAAQLQDWSAQLLPRLRLDPQQPGLLLRAQNLLKANGLQIERVDNLPAEASLGRPNARIHARVTGTDAQLFRAIIELENASPPTRITELSWQRHGAGSGVRGELTVVQTWQEAP